VGLGFVIDAGQWAGGQPAVPRGPVLPQPLGTRLRSRPVPPHPYRSRARDSVAEHRSQDPKVGIRGAKGGVGGLGGQGCTPDPPVHFPPEGFRIFSSSCLSDKGMVGGIPTLPPHQASRANLIEQPYSPLIQIVPPAAPNHAPSPPSHLARAGANSRHNQPTATQYHVP